MLLRNLMVPLLLSLLTKLSIDPKSFFKFLVKVVLDKMITVDSDVHNEECA